MGARSTNLVQSFFDNFYRSGSDASGAATAITEFSVSGGNATSTGGGYKYFYFTSPGNLSVQKVSGSDDFEMSFMLIGGGGSGDDTGSGGGGAGAFVQKVDYPVSGVPGSSVNWAIVIGDGAVDNNPGSYPKGDNSTFTIPTAPKTFTATGGASGTQSLGLSSGGSGGGGGRVGPNLRGLSSVPQTIDGSGNTPDDGIGYPGARGYNSGPSSGGTGGGGGGAGGDGEIGAANPSSNADGGRGGLGRAAFLGDTNVSPGYGTPGPSPGRWFAGGGGGGSHTSGTGRGGYAPHAGGGAMGSPASSSSYGGSPAGTENTGSGGAGGGGTSNSFIGLGSPGMKGICIVKVDTSILS